MSAIKAGWLYSGPLRSEQSQGWYVPVMDKDGTLKLVDTYVIKGCYSEHYQLMFDNLSREQVLAVFETE